MRDLCFLTAQKLRDRRNEETRVGFGRTEVSARLDGTVVCALSSGHGSRNPQLEGA